MKSNQNNDNQYTNYGLGKIPEKEPNMEPNKDPDESFSSWAQKKEEEKEERLRKYRENRREKNRRKAAEEGRTIRKKESMKHLSLEEKKERVRAQRRISRNTDEHRAYNRNYMRECTRKRVEENGGIYIPPKEYKRTSRRVEQTSQPVEQASIQTPRYNGA